MAWKKNPNADSPGDFIGRGGLGAGGGRTSPGSTGGRSPKMSAGQLIKSDIKRTQDLKLWSKRGPHGKYEQGAKINKGGTTDFTSKKNIAKLKRQGRVGRKPDGYKKGDPYWD